MKILIVNDNITKCLSQSGANYPPGERGQNTTTPPSKVAGGVVVGNKCEKSDVYCPPICGQRRLVHHLAQRRMREHGLNKFRFSGLQSLTHNVTLD